MSALHYTADTRIDRPTEIIRQMVQLGPLVVVNPGLMADLAAEFHSQRRATRWLAQLATRINRPIGMHSSDATTAFVSPRDWSEDRLLGWIAARHDVIERTYGEVSQIRRAS